jgi:Flp pilus assembly protein TadG
MIKTKTAHFWRRRNGNASLLFALLLPVVIFAVGASVDFGRATVARTRLNSAADAAALAALTPTMMQQSASAAQIAVVNMFNSQIANISSLVAGDTTVSVTITNPNGNAVVRNVQVSYTAQSQNIFAGVLGMASLSLAGTSIAQASIPPNIDFYLLLDNSPSMSLPATSAGITQMQDLTSSQYSGAGCAFACHEANTNASTNGGDTDGNPCQNGTAPNKNTGLCSQSQGPQIDNYQLALNNGITLRLNELSAAVTTLMNLAYDTATSGQWSTPPNYRFAAYSMDTLWNVPTANNSLMTLTTNYVSGWTTASQNFGVMEMYQNSEGCANASCSSSVSFNDVATDYDTALSSIDTTMPKPGKGTNVTGDTPQEVLFFVTDGVEDELTGGNRLIQTINGSGGTNYCTEIKNRGIQIAILYTEYLPVPVNSFYVSNVEPIQTDLGPALQACASPGLFYDAAIGADLGQALSALFQAVVQSATLTH